MEKFQVVAFYKYCIINDPEVFQIKHLKYCQKLGIGARILVAKEGLNGQLSGTLEQTEKYMVDLLLDPRFENTDFKVDINPTNAFHKCHVRVKPEIVHSGLHDVNPAEQTGIHLDADGFKALKDREDVVVIDVRSNYEHKVGKFKGAVTFDIQNFREFPDHIADLEQYRDKKIITYCTGGIKCEKASAYLLKQGFKDVYQLDGGIIKYAKDSGGEDFEGVLYVFDGRVTVPVNTVNPTVITDCLHCQTPTTRYINCANELCNKRIISCEPCGWIMEGCCSEDCKNELASKRVYDGTGYYPKTGS